MPHLLQINASLNLENGQSTQLAQAFVEQWQSRHPDHSIRVRDVAAEPVPHLDAARFTAFTTAAEKRTAEQQAVVAYSDQLIDELQQADTIVIGLPMYNFGVPSQLKAWIDHVARAGVTFRYTESGPVGLLTGKKAYILAARGGKYAGTPRDTQTTYVRDFLAFIGITDVEFVYAEGLALGEESRSQALEGANEVIDRLAA